MTTVAIFSSSLVITLAMILMKAAEIRKGNRNFILRNISKLDAKLENAVSSAKFRILQFIQSVRYIFLVQIKETFDNFFNKMEAKIMSELHARQSAMMGRRNITNKGSVSFYLKKITEEKENGKRKAEKIL